MGVTPILHRPGTSAALLRHTAERVGPGNALGFGESLDFGEDLFADVAALLDCASGAQVGGMSLSGRAIHVSLVETRVGRPQ